MYQTRSRSSAARTESRRKAVITSRVNSGIPGQSVKPGHPETGSSSGAGAVVKAKVTYLLLSPNSAIFSDISMNCIDAFVYELWAWL